jgi:hypothetical protein
VTALHGVATLGSTVLMAEELADGHGQLISLDLARQAEATRSVIFTAPELDHLITEPTATVDPTTGVLIAYWVDQWKDPDGTLHGNIWSMTLGGIAQPVTANDISFAPKAVAGKLFWLEAVPAPNGSTSGQPAPTATAPASTPTPGLGGGSSVNSQVIGIIYTETLDGRPDLDSGKTSVAGTLDTPVSEPQAGATFIVWHTQKSDYSLYNLSDNQTHPLNSSITNPLEVSISPTAVLWVTNDSPNSSQITISKTAINLLEAAELA